MTGSRRWAKDMREWGTREGTKEAVINEVVILNKAGKNTRKIIPGEEVTIKVYFSVNEEINDVHFGLAIFREDGVYCYGTNSKIDSLSIKQLVKGNGYFQISYKKFLLMPGVYYLSMAIWDANEVFAYDYYKCKYKIEVAGNPIFEQLLYLPIEEGRDRSAKLLKFPGEIKECYPRLDYLTDKWGDELKNDLITLESIRCVDAGGVDASVFVTGNDMKIEVDFKIDGCIPKRLILWLGIYRSDRIYCHGNIRLVNPVDKLCEIFIYPKLKLLPGGYRVSVGLWDPQKDNFIVYSHARSHFDMISDRRDHGTVYMEHSWVWKLPKGTHEDE